MTLFEINETIRFLCEMMIDEDTGEIKQDVVDNLQEISFKKEEKLESYALLIKENKYKIDALKQERANINAKIKRIESSVDWLTNTLKGDLNGEVFETPKVTVRYRKSKQLVTDDKLIDLFEEMHPEYIKTKIDKSYDKKSIKDAILKEGKEFEGCYIQENINLNIK